MKNSLEKCIWKCVVDSKGTTYEDIRKKEHPLYRCLDCSGKTEQGDTCEFYKDKLEILR